MRDPNKPLLAPGLVSGKVTAAHHNGEGGGGGGYYNGHHHGDSNGHVLKTSSDFNRISSGGNFVEDFRKTTDHVYSSSNLKSGAGKRKGGGKVPPAVAPKPIMRESEVDARPALLASSLRDERRSSYKLEPAKEFGQFSALVAPALLSGKKGDANNNNNSGETTTTTRTTTETREEEYITTR